MQPCVLHTLSKGIKHSLGHERYKHEIEKDRKFNNPDGAKLIQATTDQVKVFDKSWPKRLKLTNIQNERSKAKLYPFCAGCNTSLRGDNSQDETKNALAFVTPGDTR